MRYAAGEMVVALTANKTKTKITQKQRMEREFDSFDKKPEHGKGECIDGDEIEIEWDTKGQKRLSVEETPVV